MLDTASAACSLKVNQIPWLYVREELHGINFSSTQSEVSETCHLNSTFPARWRLLFQY